MHSCMYLSTVSRKYFIQKRETACVWNGNVIGNVCLKRKIVSHKTEQKIQTLDVR